jgi:hypothetical protein
MFGPVRGLLPLRFCQHLPLRQKKSIKRAQQGKPEELSIFCQQYHNSVKSALVFCFHTIINVRLVCRLRSDMDFFGHWTKKKIPVKIICNEGGKFITYHILKS